MKPYNVEAGKDGAMHLIPNNHAPETARPKSGFVPLHRVDGRASGTETVVERKWWEVEYLDGKVWRPDYLRHRTQSLAGALHECAQFQIEHPTRVRVVEVVQRRRVVEEVPAGSSIIVLSNPEVDK